MCTLTIRINIICTFVQQDYYRDATNIRDVTSYWHVRMMRYKQTNI